MANEAPVGDEGDVGKVGKRASGGAVDVAETGRCGVEAERSSS